MKFNELFVGDVFNFVNNDTDLGTCILTSLSEIDAGDIKLIYNSSDNRCYSISESDGEFKLINGEVILPFDAEIELLTKSSHDNVYNAVSYNGARIVYSCKEDQVFITKDKNTGVYDTFSTKNGIELIGVSYEYDDALKYTFVA